MRLLSKLFNQKTNEIPEIPSLDEIVEMMFDKSMSFTEDLQVIRVIYNNDKTKRFILLKSKKGYYKYTYEELCIRDQDEWVYICNEEDACPAWWETKDRSFAYSFFGTEKEAMSTLTQESIYREYFENNENGSVCI